MSCNSVVLKKSESLRFSVFFKVSELNQSISTLLSNLTKTVFLEKLQKKRTYFFHLFEKS